MAIQKIERQKPIERNAKERARTFDEVSLGFNEERAVLEASRCLNCKTAPCKNGCPVSVNIPEFLNEIKNRNFDKAIEIIKETNYLPAVCGRVCPQEEQCEKVCIRNKMEGSVAIGYCERFVADLALSKEQKITKTEPNGKRVAVVGSGPSSLTVAADLIKAGYDVTILEAFHSLGGVLVYGIPEFRLPKEIVAKEINNLEKMGVKFELNTVVGKTVLMPELLEEYDAVFLGTGAGLPVFLNIKGENLNGVYSANEYLTRVNLMKAYKKDSNTPVQRGKNVIVVGAGNVAMDAARTALRLGADSVKIVYRRSRDEMPARKEEIHHAEEEGVELNLLNNPVEIIGENGFVTGMKVRKMQLGELDASGRRKPVEIEGSENIIACDMVIMSIGTSPNPLLKDSYKILETSKRGTIIVNELTNETNIENVYAGGDAVTGAATVILAMGAGKKAAKSIIEKGLAEGKN